VPAGKVFNGIFDSLDWLPTLVAAAGGPADLPERLKLGYEGYRVHLDGVNQLGFLKGKSPSNRESVFYYETTTLQAVRHNDWKAHFVVQNHGWGGAKEKLNAPLLFVSLRQVCVISLKPGRNSRAGAITHPTRISGRVAG
jgi:arylsulfatase